MKASTLLGHAILLLILVLGVYSGTFHATFHFDDSTNIIDNPAIRDLGNFLPGADVTSVDKLGNFGRRSVGFLSFALNYRFNGLDTEGYHVVNILIHFINVLFVYALTLLALRTPRLRMSVPTGDAKWAALFAAALFAVHPVQTQAVTYIVQRFSSLATLFYAGSMVLYTMSRLSDKGRKRWVLYALSLVFCILGMKTKEITFTLPLMLLLWEAMFFEGPWKHRFALLVPFMLTLAIIPLEVYFAPRTGVANGLTVFNIPHLHYLFTEARVLITYLRLLLLPLNQSLDYDYPIYTSLFRLPVLLSLVILGLLFVSGVFLIRRDKRADGSVKALAGFGIIWFFLSISVVSTFVPLQPMFEHRLYLPMVGVSMAMGATALLFARKMHGLRRSLFLAACVALVMVLCILARERNRVWKNEITLWTDVTQKAPGNARAFIALGSAYYKYGIAEEARQAYEQADELFRPFLREFRTMSLSEHRRRLQEKGPYARNSRDYAMLQYDLGLLAAKSGHTEDAVSRFKIALRASPDYTNASYNLARVYYRLGRYKEARSTAAQALEYSPSDQGLWALLKQIETAMHGGNERK